MGFIVIEGLDGSGKSTQIDLLKKYLDAQEISNEYIHFPTNESPVFGDLIARFLRGELGKLNDVDPYLVALLFAGDRYNMNSCLSQWLADGKTVINDRYVYSNIGYQCAKTSGEQEFDKLFDWIFEMEFNYFKIKKPDISIFLDVPFEFTKKKLQENREGDARDYLKGKVDIHEADLEFQKKVKKAYLKAISKDDNFIRLACYDDNNNILSPTQISNMIINLLKEKKIINN